MKPEAGADRADYRSMARLARGLYEAGLNEREVLRRCYDFDLPDEFFAVAGNSDDFEVVEFKGVTYALAWRFTNQPWQLAVPLSRGGPDPEPDVIDEREQWLLAIEPKFVPLFDRTYRTPVHGGHVCCYHVDELRAGRTTIFGVPPSFDGTAEPARLADSLLSLLHDWASRALGELEREAQWNNRGAGSVTCDEIEVARQSLERVERLRHGLAGPRENTGA